MTTTTTSTGIRQRRIALGISRVDLSIRCGISSSWMAELEQGRQHGPALARVLRVLDELEAEQEA
jgi:predicted transcriptional regulator